MGQKTTGCAASPAQDHFVVEHGAGLGSDLHFLLSGCWYVCGPVADIDSFFVFCYFFFLFEPLVCLKTLTDVYKLISALAASFGSFLPVLTAAG